MTAVLSCFLNTLSINRSVANKYFCLSVTILPLYADTITSPSMKSLKNVLDISITALYWINFLWQSNSAVSRIEHCVIPCVRSFGGNSSRREVNESVGLVSMTEGSGKGVVTPNPPSHRYIELSSFISLCLKQVNDRSPCCLPPSGPVRNPTHLPLCFLMQIRVIPLAIRRARVYTHRCA